VQVQYKDFNKSQESRPLLTTVLQTDAFFCQDTVPSLYILHLNKYSKILNSWIGFFGSNRIATNYSIWSEILNIRTALQLAISLELIVSVWQEIICCCTVFCLQWEVCRRKVIRWKRWGGLRDRSAISCWRRLSYSCSAMPTCLGTVQFITVILLSFEHIVCLQGGPKNVCVTTLPCKFLIMTSFMSNRGFSSNMQISYFRWAKNVNSCYVSI